MNNLFKFLCYFPSCLHWRMKFAITNIKPKIGRKEAPFRDWVLPNFWLDVAQFSDLFSCPSDLPSSGTLGHGPVFRLSKSIFKSFLMTRTFVRENGLLFAALFGIVEPTYMSCTFGTANFDLVAQRVVGHLKCSIVSCFLTCSKCLSIKRARHSMKYFFSRKSLKIPALRQRRCGWRGKSWEPRPEWKNGARVFKVSLGWVRTGYVTFFILKLADDNQDIEHKFCRPCRPIDWKSWKAKRFSGTDHT